MMGVTRRQMIGGMAGILASSTASAALVRSALGARGVASVGGKALPYDSEVEWIGSNIGSYIVTGVKPNNETAIELKIIEPDGVVAGNVVSGGDGWMNRMVQFSLVADGRFGFVFGNKQAPVFPPDGQSGIIKIERHKLFQNGVEISDSGYSNEFSSDSEMAIFATNRNHVISEIAVIGIKVCWMKISNGGLLVEDFIPVRFTNSLGVSECAMYDRVSGQLFRNAGTGAFMIGPDKT